MPWFRGAAREPLFSTAGAASVSRVAMRTLKRKKRGSNAPGARRSMSHRPCGCAPRETGERRGGRFGARFVLRGVGGVRAAAGCRQVETRGGNAPRAAPVRRWRRRTYGHRADGAAVVDERDCLRTDGRHVREAAAAEDGRTRRWPESVRAGGRLRRGGAA
eukprot:4352361-Prymnesium_polylepis.1